MQLPFVSRKRHERVKDRLRRAAVRAGRWQRAYTTLRAGIDEERRAGREQADTIRRLHTELAAAHAQLEAARGPYRDTPAASAQVTAATAAEQREEHEVRHVIARLSRGDTRTAHQLAAHYRQRRAEGADHEDLLLELERGEDVDDLLAGIG